MSAVTNAVNELNDRLVLGATIGESLDLAGGQNAPAWVHVYQRQVESIRQASEVLETLLRGDGGYAPHDGAASSQALFSPRGAVSNGLAGSSIAP